MAFEDGSDRLVRAAYNQAMFRGINEEIQGLEESFQSVADDAGFVCECADMACTQQLELTVPEYEEIRGESNSFVVAPGHLYLDVERVERESERYVVVAKLGEGSQIAAVTDPRSDPASWHPPPEGRVRNAR